MKYYIMVVGPYDSTFQGPYTDKDKAEVDRLEISKGPFTTSVLTEDEMGENIAEFGECPIQEPQ